MFFIICKSSTGLAAPLLGPHQIPLPWPSSQVNAVGRTKGTTLPLDHANSWSVGQFGHQLRSFHCPSTKTFMATQIFGWQQQHTWTEISHQSSQLRKNITLPIQLYLVLFFLHHHDLQLWEEVRSEIHFLKAETAQGWLASRKWSAKMKHLGPCSHVNESTFMEKNTKITGNGRRTENWCFLLTSVLHSTYSYAWHGDCDGIGLDRPALNTHIYHRKETIVHQLNSCKLQYILWNIWDMLRSFPANINDFLLYCYQKSLITWILQSSYKMVDFPIPLGPMKQRTYREN